MARVALALLALSSGRSAVFAQDLEPRFYTNVPIGFNFVAAGYGSSQGNVLFDPSIALDNAELQIDGLLIGYGRSLGFGRHAGKFDVAVGDVCLDGSADFEGERVTRDVCGLTDARVRVMVNFIGAPALRPQEFGNFRQNLVVGASLQLGVPVGDYDPSRLANIGANRWSAKAEIGVSKDLPRWLLEVALADTFYEDNDEFFGGRERSQDPIWSLQGHAVRKLESGVWLAVDATWYGGGRTTSGGVLNDDLQRNGRLGLTVSVPLNARNSLKFAASTGVSTRTGTDFDTIAAAWQYSWRGKR
jgi:hypothetical protein